MTKSDRQTPRQGGATGPVDGAARESPVQQPLESELGKVFHDTGVAMLLLDAGGKIARANTAAARLVGSAAQKLVGQSIYGLLKRRGWECLRRALAGICAGGSDESLLTLDLGLAEDAQRWALLNTILMRSPFGTPDTAVLAVQYVARCDRVTGLPNRREFERHARRAFESTRRSTTEHLLAYLELEQFKIVNDSGGHKTGDELLRLIGATLQDVMRKRDTLARLGGDEFGILLEYCRLERAEPFMERLLDAIRQLGVEWGGQKHSIRVRIGLAALNSASDDVREILGRLQATCQRVDEHSRDGVRVYRDSGVAIRRWQDGMKWVARITHALRTDNFSLYCQPIRSLHQHSAPGLHCEVLLRMQDEDGALVLPGNFLPAAERYGLVGRVDRWVVKATFAALNEAGAHLDHLQMCSINLSGCSLADFQFLQFVEAQFMSCGVPPHKVCFEVTETSAITDLASAAVFVKRLKQLGCWFTLDDFGSCQGSFACLKSLPVDFLKIDGRLIRGIAEDPIDFETVKSISDIGHLMGKKTIAEFVETQKVAKLIRACNVDYMQGYAVSDSRPFDTLLAELSGDVTAT